MTLINFVLLASTIVESSLGDNLKYLIIIAVITFLAIKVAKYEEDIYISDGQTNKVIHVRLVGGIIGLFFGSPQSALNNRIRNENIKGWNVVQIIPAESGNIFLLIFRLLILVLTLFLYSPANGFYVIMERETPTGNYNRSFPSSEKEKHETPAKYSPKEIGKHESAPAHETISYSKLSGQEKKIIDYFIKNGLRNEERLVINKVNRRIEKFNEMEWSKIVKDSQHNEWITISV